MAPQHTNALLSAAVAAMLAGGAVSLTSCKSSPSAEAQGEMSATAKHACQGLNACKAQGGCQTADHACAGKNACKGKGGCATAEKHACQGMNACKAQGGCKTGDNGCAGKNSCKGKGGCAVPVKR